ncbi:hypothetical protein H7X68_02465 [Candidatus Saccharibacteria bacterium]|nr:hypothetical protein [Candidatus Saccharibacteria bacterium]
MSKKISKPNNKFRYVALGLLAMTFLVFIIALLFIINFANEPPFFSLAPMVIPSRANVVPWLNGALALAIMCPLIIIFLKQKVMNIAIALIYSIGIIIMTITGPTNIVKSNYGLSVLSASETDSAIIIPYLLVWLSIITLWLYVFAKYRKQA